MPTLTAILDEGLDFPAYAAAYERGQAPDRYPYGLEGLPEGWDLRFPVARAPSRIRGLVRRVVRRATGVDAVAALGRWSDIRQADVIYSHSEADYLGVALVLRLMRARRPVLVGQTIWLFAGWADLPPWRQRWLRYLMSRVDLFVYNARDNARLGEEIMPAGRHRYVPFGVSRVFGEAGVWAGGRRGNPLVVSVGNDRARDWRTLAGAVDGLPATVDVRLASREAPPGMERAETRATTSVPELCALYRDAALLVVPLLPNAHASGITTILEGAAVGTPLVATDAGGLREYFDDDAIRFVAPGDPGALRSAMMDLLGDRDLAASTGAAARAVVAREGYTNDAYWRRVIDEVNAYVTERRP